MRPGQQLRRDPPHRADRPRGRQPVAVAPPLVSPAPQSKHAFGWRVAALTLMLTATIVLAATQLAPVWSSLLRERAATRALDDLAQLETFELPARFQDWRTRGTTGLTWTVRALASSQPRVSYFAEQSLTAELDDWRSQPPAEYLPRMVAIARELALQVDRLPASRFPFVRQLVQRLAETRGGNRNQEQQLIAACEDILARLPPATPDELRLAEDERRRTLEDSRLARSLEAAPAAIEPLPVPLESELLDPVPPGDLPPPEVDEDGNRLKPLPKSVPKRFFAPRAQELPTTPVQTPDDAPLLPPATDTARKSVPEWVAGLVDLEVMRLLHHGDYGVRYTAERELGRRGYAREHLEVAKQLVHPDPRERKLLAERLPRMTNLDPRPWLLQLTEDSDAGVRRTAEVILQASKPGREAR